MGYRTRRGAKFSDTTIKRLLRDPTAKGIHLANYTKSLGENKRWVLKPKEEWVFQEVEPIVSEELWNQCNAILDSQEREERKPTRRTSHLFSGLVFCHCGKKMYVPSNSPKYTCPKCRNKIRESDLEEIFCQQLKDFTLLPEELENYLLKANEVIREKEERLNGLIQEEREIRKEMDRIYRLYIDDKIDADGFGEKYKPLEIRLKQIKNQIPELQGEIDFLKIQALSRDEILSQAKDLSSRWPNLNFEEKRKIVENITERITIGQDEILIDLSYLPSKMVATGQSNLRGSSPRSR
jgi:site-specific DNA recombinase